MPRSSSAAAVVPVLVPEVVVEGDEAGDTQAGTGVSTMAADASPAGAGVGQAACPARDVDAGAAGKPAAGTGCGWAVGPQVQGLEGRRRQQQGRHGPQAPPQEQQQQPEPWPWPGAVQVQAQLAGLQAHPAADDGQQHNHQASPAAATTPQGPGSLLLDQTWVVPAWLVLREGLAGAAHRMPWRQLVVMAAMWGIFTAFLVGRRTRTGYTQGPGHCTLLAGMYGG